MYVNYKKYTKEENGIKQFNAYVGFCEITPNVQWDAGCPYPILCDSEAGLKKIKLTVCVYGNNRMEIREKARKFTQIFMKKAQLDLEGYENDFMVTLSNASYREDSPEHFHTVTLDLVGCEYKSRQDYISEILVPTIEKPIVEFSNTWDTDDFICVPLSVSFGNHLPEEKIAFTQYVEVFLNDELLLDLTCISENCPNFGYFDVDLRPDHGQVVRMRNWTTEHVNYNIYKTPILPRRKNNVIKIATGMGSDRYTPCPIEFMIYGAGICL